MTAAPRRRPRRLQRSLVLAANRLPVQRDLLRHRWEISPGGLVTALSSITEQHDVAWVGWPGERSRRLEPFELKDKLLVPVRLDPAELEAYYDGFCNATMWPLLHDLPVRPQYHRHWWDPYRAVNERFAVEIARVAAAQAVVWVHDYHLMLVPRMLREMRPDLRIGFFLHVPFPGPELFLQVPWRTQLLEGVCGADLVGLQTEPDALNFEESAVLSGAVRRSASGIRVGRRRVEVGAFPISVDTASIEAQADRPEIAEQAARLRADLGSPKTVLLGIDRLDYTKGISVRLWALQELLEAGALSGPEDVVFVQVAVPSRERLGSYSEERRRIANSVSDLNGRFGRIGQPVVHYLTRNLGFDELLGLYRAADVMLVTPLKDGMNLVAQEYVAASLHGRGVLVLSEFAGAAHELHEAVIVNPYDVEGVKQALMAAVEMPEQERARRMTAMRRRVERADVHAWSGEFMARLGGAASPASR